MLLITNEVCTSGAESKQGPSKDHPDLGMKLLKMEEDAWGKESKKILNCFHSNYRKVSRARERVRKHKCSSLGKMQQADFQGILGYFFQNRETENLSKLGLCYEGKHILGSLYILPIHYLSYISMLLIKFQKGKKK